MRAMRIAHPARAPSRAVERIASVERIAMRSTAARIAAAPRPRPRPRAASYDDASVPRVELRARAETTSDGRGARDGDDE
jgi:hypothetical protein